MSKIQWTDETWNVAVGCSRVSPGCENCYAERVAHRGLSESHRGLTVLGKRGPRWTGDVRFLPERLEAPFRWRKPRRVFVNSMSDLFHERISNEEIAAVFGVMAATPQHTYQVLTKRPGRAAEFFAWLGQWNSAGLVRDMRGERCVGAAIAAGVPDEQIPVFSGPWPLQNVRLGVSVENQETADERIPLLLNLAAAVRWVSYEPALGPVDFNATPAPPGWTPINGATLDDLRGCLPTYQADGYQLSGGLDWVVVGGESGPGARPFELAWARTTIEQCRGARIPCFWKQAGSHPVDGGKRVRLADRKGGDMAEWPAPLRVREWPA